ncbi:hypothetical protein E8M01_28045 [Phreatobacter stygius]|uniref:BrnA antitoxin family protein n=1 Tax=Phreatobacter stygius TaxID=1940610 RepID=A0A4D7BAA1_9HYPH|nr:hypothetical protein E8M01_28045 [Phreatobacter stygius]
MTRIKNPTDAEEAAIQRQIASDPDAPEATDQQLRKAKPFAAAFPDLMNSIKRARGRPKLAAPKEAVTLRLDPAVVSAFRATGGEWRANMGKVLEQAAAKTLSSGKGRGSAKDVKSIAASAMTAKGRGDHQPTTSSEPKRRPKG